jgi:hypothetical protein
MDGLLIGSGLAALLIGAQAIIRPTSMVRESLRNRNRRLDEIRNGAPEKYFEERRELEAYPPRFDLDDRTIRALGVVGAIIGLISLYQGLPLQ